MRKIALAAMLLVLCVGSARADETRRDGNWWNARDRSMRSAYVVGMLDGMELGMLYSQPDFFASDSKEVTEAGIKELVASVQRYNAFAKKYFQNVTAGQIADGLDAFYADFRNRSIRVYLAVNVVVRQIAGDDVDEMVQTYRKAK